MPDQMREVYNIDLKLTSNMATTLDKSLKAFEGFIQKANTSTRTLEKSITSMQTNLAKSYEGMFKGSRKEVEGLVMFSRSSIQSISASTTKIMKAAEAGQAALNKKIDANIAKIKQWQKEIGVHEGQRKDPETSKADQNIARDKAEALRKQIKEVEKDLSSTSKKHIKELSVMLGKHFNEIAETVRRKSKAVSLATKKLIDDTLSQWNRIKSQTQFMGQAQGTVHKKEGVDQLVNQQKQAFNNLKELRETHKLAQNAVREQNILRSKAEGDALKKHHEQLALSAQKNLERVKKEYISAGQKVRAFGKQIRGIKGDIDKSGQGLLKEWKEQLKPSRLQGLFQPMVDNIRNSSKLAGKGFMDQLMASIGEGDKLAGKLDKFKNKLVSIRQEAEMLVKAGLIDENKIIPKIKKAETALKKFEQRIRKTKQEFDKFSPKKMASFKIPELGDLDSLKDKIRALTSSLPALGKISRHNFAEISAQIKQTKTVFEEHAKVRQKIASKINVLEAEATRVRHQIRNVENRNLRKAMVEYVHIIEGKAAQAKKALDNSIRLDKSKIALYEKEMSIAVSKIISSVKRITSGAAYGTPEKLFSGIKKQYEMLSNQIDKLSHKKIITSSAIDRGKEKVDELKRKVNNYKNVIVKLQEEYKKLQVVQRGSFRNEAIRRQMVLLKEQINAMKVHSAEVQRMAHHASRRIEQVQRTGLKSIVRSSWEMIRNFRWQVAAVIYLVSRAVQAVKRVFLGVMDEIAKFRRDAMSLAAQYSFKMFGDMKTNFNNAYKFSRQLMQKLEIVAAETILTMEDMLMLTKTFAQAGIIPRTDEDLNRIATIGTAIKALTEGMANAGVQMKQELYAIIAGRQRATDQLAMMFKLMGKDIQQMIDDGKKKGKNMIEVLADALKPFSVMNDALKDEWEAVINKLKIVWKIIKRIALEDSLLQSAKALKDFVETFWTKAEGLTKRGREAVASLKAGFEMTRAIVVAIVIQMKTLFNYMGQISATSMTLVGLSSKVEGNIEAANSGLKGFLQLAEFTLKVIWLISSTFTMITNTIEGILAPINYIIEAFKAGGSYLASWALHLESFVTIDSKMRKALKDTAKKQMELADAGLKAANKRMFEAGNALWSMISDAGKEYEKVDNIVGDILDKMKKVTKEAALLNKEFKLTYPTGVFDAWSTMKTEMDRAEAAQYKGPKRFQVEHDQKVLLLEDLKMRTKKNLADMMEMEIHYKLGTLKMTYEKHKEFLTIQKAHRDIAAETHKYETYLANETARKTQEWNRKEEIRMARGLRKYEQFMRKVSNVQLNPKEKAQDWYKKMLIDVKELAVTSKFFADNMNEVQEAIKGGLKLREDAGIEKMNLEFDKFIAKASKASAWNNVFEEINIEFSEYVRQAEKATTLEKERLPELKKQFDIIKAQRKEQEKINLIHQAYLAQLDVQTKKAEYLKGAYSPVKQRAGEIMALKTSHNQSMSEMSKKLDEHNRRWKENGEYKKEAIAATRAEGKAIEEMMVQMSLATKRELQKKQMPIWNDLVEASNSWADGLTDALSNIVDGIGSVKEALDELQKTIIKDVLKTMIKRTVTDNLQDMLGSGFMGSETPFQKMFGGGKKGKEGEAQEITATKPIPVIIYNTQDLLNPTVKTFDKMEKFTLPDEGMGQRVFVTNWPGGGMEGLFGSSGGVGEIAAKGVQGVSQDLADISSEIAENTEEASKSGTDWLAKIKDGFSGIGSWISGLFSSGASGGASGGGGSSTGSTLMGMGMMAASAYGYAKGGVISEPIVGKGLKSGETYNFGENTKYGENEIVAPIKKMQKTGSRNQVQYHMPIHISAIDTQSGVQFLMRHSDVIQTQLSKNLRQNKPIRKGIQNAY
jgi:hypothetical protein